MKTLMLLLALAGGVPGYGGAILFLTGASCLEELDAQTLERFEELARRPLDLNAASRSRLLASGLMNPFQVASLLDARGRGGDILSYTELGLLDGFSPEFAEALGPFTVLRSASPPGRALSGNVSQDVLARASWREGVLSGGAKYSVDVSGRFEAHWASAVTYSSRKAAPGTFSAVYRGRTVPFSLVAGDFNARFGQGTAMWSGFTLSGLPSVESFLRNGTGFTPASGFSSENHRGLAAAVDLGRWNVSAGLSLPGLRKLVDTGRRCEVGLLPMLGVSRTGRNVSLSLFSDAEFSGSARAATLSASVLAGFSSLRLAAESSFRAGTDTGPGFASVATLAWAPSYGRSVALQGRFYSPSFSGQWSGSSRSRTKVSDEAALSAGVRLPWLSLTGDWSRVPSTGEDQFKGVLALSGALAGEGGLSLTPSARISARYRPGEAHGLRTDARADLLCRVGDLYFAGRYNLVFCDGRSWLWYAEAGWRRASLRFTLFKVDKWDDRIYSYERDAPGCFSVPAYYGRGFSVGAFAGGRLGKRHSLYARASFISWPWNQEPKDSRLELKLQYGISLN